MNFPVEPNQDSELLPAVATRTNEVSDEIVDRVVKRLNELSARASLEVALAIGRLIVNEFYGGDLSAWRIHRAKEASFRKLAARATQDLRMSATCLYRAVALYELSCRVRIDEFSQLSMTHLRAVLGLPAAEQATLLGQSNQERWSSEQLEQAVCKVRKALLQKRGRPAAPPLMRAIRKLMRTWPPVESAMCEAEVEGLSLAQVQSLSQATDDLKGRLDRFSRWLSAYRTERT